MEKTITNEQYRTLIHFLRETRETKGVTQVELGEMINENQNFISKIETFAPHLTCRFQNLLMTLKAD